MPRDPTLTAERRRRRNEKRRQTYDPIAHSQQRQQRTSAGKYL